MARTGVPAAVEQFISAHVESVEQLEILLDYWRQTRDRLFLMFAGGFFTFSVSRLILAEPAEARTPADRSFPSMLSSSSR